MVKVLDAAGSDGELWPYVEVPVYDSRSCLTDVVLIKAAKGTPEAKEFLAAKRNRGLAALLRCMDGEGRGWKEIY